MRVDELADLAALLDQLIRYLGDGSVHTEQLRKARTEISGWTRKGENVPARAVVRIVRVVSRVVSDEFVKKSATKGSGRVA